MKRFYLSTVLSCAVVLFLSGCGFGDAAKEAEKYADKFHKHLRAKNENAMLNFIHDEAMAKESEAFEELIHRMATELEVEKVEKTMGFNTSVNNGVTTVTLNYTLHDKQHGEIKEQMVLRDADSGGMKIVGLKYD